MSIVVAVKKGKEIAVAADTVTSCGSLRVESDNHRAIKIRKVGSALVGATGWGVYDNILDDFLAAKKRPALTTKQSIFSFFIAFWRELHERYPFVNDQCDSELRSPFADLDADFLIANPSGIYQVAADMSVTEFQKYYAIGSGSGPALGALYALYDSSRDAETLARKAVEAAVAFNVHCGGEIVVRKIKARA